MNRILKLIQEKGMNQKDFCKTLGIGEPKFTDWKTGRIKSYRKYLPQIADCLDVSVDYLLGKTEYASELAPNIYPVEGLVEFAEIGTVKAGYDGLVEEIPTGRTVTIPVEMLKGRPPEDYFLLKVKGDSMYPLLLDGDSILCLRTDSVDSGSTAVVLYDNEDATVKKVNYTYGEDWLDLVPANPEYKAKRIEGTDLEKCRVLGKVVKLIRDF